MLKKKELVSSTSWELHEISQEMYYILLRWEVN